MSKKFVFLHIGSERDLNNEKAENLFSQLLSVKKIPVSSHYYKGTKHLNRKSKNL